METDFDKEFRLLGKKEQKKKCCRCWYWLICVSVEFLRLRLLRQLLGQLLGHLLLCDGCLSFNWVLLLLNGSMFGKRWRRDGFVRYQSTADASEPHWSIMQRCDHGSIFQSIQLVEISWTFEGLFWLCFPCLGYNVFVWNGRNEFSMLIRNTCGILICSIGCIDLEGVAVEQQHKRSRGRRRNAQLLPGIFIISVSLLQAREKRRAEVAEEEEEEAEEGEKSHHWMAGCEKVFRKSTTKDWHFFIFLHINFSFFFFIFFFFGCC